MDVFRGLPNDLRGVGVVPVRYLQHRLQSFLGQAPGLHPFHQGIQIFGVGRIIFVQRRDRGKGIKGLIADFDAAVRIDPGFHLLILRGHQSAGSSL